MLNGIRSYWPRPRLIALTISLALVIGSLAATLWLNASQELRPGPNEYNINAWEVRNFPTKWLYKFGDLFREQPGEAEQNDLVQLFLDLTREINALEAMVSNDSQRGLPPDYAVTAIIGAKQRERDSIENRVEATIEHRISLVLEDLGLERSLPLLPDIVWPPVDFEFTQPPRSLAKSARDRIVLLETTLLQEDLSLAEIEAIEEAAQVENDNTSALAFRTGGIGAYPTIVGYSTTYRDLLELVAHEWSHNYLFFSPLGFNYFKSNDVRTMNETTADLIGREVADAVIERWPLQGETIEQAPPAADSQLDANVELRRLRVEVDELLALARVDEAETLMEQRRQELVAAGFSFRKLNQAYFAFTNLYAGEAGNPAAVNPIGPKIDELRKLSGSLEEFVDAISGLTSVTALDQALTDRR